MMKAPELLFAVGASVMGISEAGNNRFVKDSFTEQP